MTIDTQDTQLAFLHTLYTEDVGLVASLIEQFQTQTPAFMAELETCIEHKNFTALHTATHTFKGMCLNLGFSTLGNLLKELELYAQAEHAPHSTDKLVDIQTEIDNILTALQQFDI